MVLSLNGDLMQLTPSILTIDFFDISAEVGRVPSADGLHLDVMDNHFVPNLTFGLPVVEAIRKHSDKKLDVHLMIQAPELWAPEYAEAGIDVVTFHAEASYDPVNLARELRALGAEACIALKPATSISYYADVITEFDRILIMTVEPGFGGQKFMADMLPKIRETREIIKRTGAQISIQIDGGINQDTIAMCAEAGADVFVAGSAVFNATDPDEMVRTLRDVAIEACHH